MSVARHKLIQSNMLSLKIKSENPKEEPTIFGNVNAEDNDPIQVDKQMQSEQFHVDNVHKLGFYDQSWQKQFQTVFISWIYGSSEYD